MKKANLKIYLDDKCNLQCEYCNISHNNLQIKSIDIINFIKENIENINTESIQLLGGEPTIIYDDDFLNFINNIFNKVYIYTNLKDLSKIQHFISIFKNKAIIYASFNEEILDVFMQNAKIVKDNIQRISIVVTKTNMNKLYSYVKLLSELNIKIYLTPEEDKNLIGYSINKDELIKQLKLIFDNDLYKLLLNFEKVKHNYKASFEECKNSILIIDKQGNISSCSHTSSVYNSSKIHIFGNIFKTKIKNINVDYDKIESISFDGTKCKECKICHNYECYPRVYSSINNQIQEQICSFNRIFYDFCMSYKFFPNLESITIFTTEKCNMNCTYCFERNFKNQIGNTSNDIIKKSLDLLFKIDDGSEKKITFFGGEPTLNIDSIKYACDYYKQLKNNGLKSTVYIDINTNLLYIDDRFIDLINNIKQDIFIYISVSLDGNKEINDSQRVDKNGYGTYDRIINNVKKLRNNLYCKNSNSNCSKIKIARHGVLQNDNLLKIEDICNTIWEERELFDDFSLAYVTPDKGEHSDFSLDNLEFISNYYNKLKEDNEKDKFIIDLLKNLSLDYKSLNNQGFSACDVLKSNLAIRANGDIMPCHAFLDYIETDLYDTDIKIGNVLNIDLDNFGISLNSKWYNFIEIKDKLDNDEIEIISELGYDCKICPFKFMCHLCAANVCKIDKNLIIKNRESCMRTLNQASILLKIKEIEAIKTLDELKKLEDSKIDDLLKIIEHLGSLAISNKECIDQIVKYIEGNNA